MVCHRFFAEDINTVYELVYIVLLYRYSFVLSTHKCTVPVPVAYLYQPGIHCTLLYEYLLVQSYMYILVQQ